MTTAPGSPPGLDHTMPPFAQAFRDAWSDPTPGRLAALLHPDVVLCQPHRPPIRGREAAHREFARLLAWLPGLHGTTERAAQDGAIVFIEWQLRFTTGRGMASIRSVDRFRLEGPLGIERAVYFDQLALLRIILRQPGLWLGYARYRRDRR